MWLRAARLAFAGALLAGCLPAAAVAGTAAVEVKQTTAGPLAELTYRATPGERNDVSVSLEAGRVRVEDAAGVTPGPNCSRDAGASSSVAVCEIGDPLALAALYLGDGGDEARVGDLLFADVLLFGGAGDDRLRSDARAEYATVGRFVGGRGDDVMAGGGANTVFDEGPRRNGRDNMRASTSPQPDYGWAIRSEAWVDYGARRRSVRADLAGDRDDGERGERDLLGEGVTGIRGGRADDRLIGDAGHDQLIGGPGSDVLEGRGGDDVLLATTERRSLSLGEVVEGGVDRLLGGRGQDLLEGSTGPNVLAPGPGPDAVWGAGGADRVVGKDGFIDAIRCGRGRDRAGEDRADFVADCERSSFRHRGASPVAIAGVIADCRYGPPCPHPWNASVIVLCARPCSGTVLLALDGRAFAEVPFGPRSGPYLAISEEVFRLLERRDPRLSVTVASGGVEISANVARLPAFQMAMPRVPEVSA